MQRRKNKNKNGFTLIEAVVSIAVFSILAAIVLQIYILIINEITSYREKTIISSLADQYMEIARNLPYSEIGTLNGNPSGSLADLPNKLTINHSGNNYYVYYAVSYIDDAADGTILAGTDVAPNDYKQIKLYVINVTTSEESSFLTNIASSGLEEMGSGGALYIEVFDSVGQPVAGATVHITNDDLVPAIDLTRVTDSTGHWIEVGVEPSENNYHISVTKAGYSIDQTYPITEANPNPTKADSTVVAGVITKVGFSIDLTSDLVFYTKNQSCSPISGVGLEVRGSKLIGTSPDVYKFDNTYSSTSSGEIGLYNIEWDNYTPALTGVTYMVYGSSPIQETNILPGTEQTFTLILGPRTNNSFLAIVKDAITLNPVEGALVTLTAPGGSSEEKITGGSVWTQQSWAGGSGQVSFEDTTRYFEDDGGVSYDEVPLALRLKKIGESYIDSGYLISSSFDTGTENTQYTTLTWDPSSQDPETSAKFQIAANNDNQTWQFVGPDGTSNSYYTVPGTTIHSLANNNRFIRYKIFLSTQNSSKTPVITGLNINYVSGCYTPGQAFFYDLIALDGYSLTVTAAGYQENIISDLNISGYNTLEVLLTQ